MMYAVKSVVVLALAATSLAKQQHHQHPQPLKRADETTATTTGTGSVEKTPTSSIDYAKISEQLGSYAENMSVQPMAATPTVTLGISIPSSLRNEVMTAIPPSILVSLMNTQYRSSVASEFKAGNTPSWYEELNPDLKTFFGSMAKQIQTGDAVYTVTSTPTGSATEEGGAAGAAGETSSSSDMAQPTGADRNLVAGIAGIVGVLGVALAL